MQREMNNQPRTGNIVKEMVPLTGTLDSNCGYVEIEDCLQSYSHQISSLRIPVRIFDESSKEAIRQKIIAAKQYKVPTVTDIHSHKFVITKGMLPTYLDVCSEIGISGVKVRNDTISHDVRPREIVRLADELDLDVYFQIEDFGSQEFSTQTANSIIASASSWLEAGAVHLVVNSGEAGESFQDSNIDNLATFAEAFGLHTVMFTAPDRQQQEKFLSYFGEDVHLCDVCLSDIEFVEKLRTSGFNSYFSNQHSAA